ncbi:MAG: hypothetical protein HKL99_12750 [Burkholderiales bacterium]|jgi:hypothetical protein|nr:hypothetical protein [Burkholderiales bacterium]
MAIQITLLITEDDPELRPLYDHLSSLPDGQGKQHRARAARHALVTGIRALYSEAPIAPLVVRSQATPLAPTRDDARVGEPQHTASAHLNDFLSSAGDNAFAGL